MTRLTDSLSPVIVILYSPVAYMRVKASLARMSRILRFTPGGKYLEDLKNPECKSVTKKNSFEAWTMPCLK